MLTVIVALVHCLRRRNWFALWLVIFSIAIVVLTLKARLYATKLQDRIIRLEERERLYGLLTEPLRSRVGQLSEAQLVGLRFASDGEIPGLVEETLARSCRGRRSRSRLRCGERIISGCREGSGLWALGSNLSIITP
jgi:hypothetical protein